MSDPPPGQPMPPPEPGEAPKEARSSLVVVGGIALGLLLGFVAIPVAVSVLTAGAADSSVGFFVGLGLPLLLGVVLLVPASLRRAGAGILLGLAIGMIVGSASCLGIVGLFAASYN